MQHLTTLRPGFSAAGLLDIAVAPDGHVEVVYLLEDATVSPSVYRGAFTVRPGFPPECVAPFQVEATGASGVRITFDATGTRYVAWFLDAPDECSYVVGDGEPVALPGSGSIDVGAAEAAYYVRAAGDLIRFGEITPSFLPPQRGVLPQSSPQGDRPVARARRTAFANDEGGAAVVA